MLRRLLSLVLLLSVAPPTLACRGQSSVVSQGRTGFQTAVVDSVFVRLIERLSEPGGYFDTDNLISNEQSYLHVLGALEARGVRGGAYIGVGPDQSFSYIAHIEPEIAFIIDIRRDNQLQHLWFKALFELSRNRAEYLSLLFGKPMPTGKRWEEAPIAQLLEYIDATPTRTAVLEANREAIHAALRSTGIPLSDDDLGIIERIHDSFISAGTDLRFTSHNRPPRAYYPTYRQLVLERDLAGRMGSYLATEGAFRVVKDLQERNRIVPVVGDLAGTTSLRAIGEYLTEQRIPVSAFYTSNVEFYLMRSGTFDRFAENVQTLHHDERSVIIRSYFGGWYRRRHPQAVTGYFSSQLLQPVTDFLSAHRNGGYVSYFDLVTRDALELR